MRLSQQLLFLVEKIRRTNQYITHLVRWRGLLGLDCGLISAAFEVDRRRLIAAQRRLKLTVINTKTV